MEIKGTIVLSTAFTGGIPHRDPNKSAWIMREESDSAVSQVGLKVHSNEICS